MNEGTGGTSIVIVAEIGGRFVFQIGIQVATVLDVGGARGRASQC